MLEASYRLENCRCVNYKGDSTNQTQPTPSGIILWPQLIAFHRPQLSLAALYINNKNNLKQLSKS